MQFFNVFHYACKGPRLEAYTVYSSVVNNAASIVSFYITKPE